MSIDFSQIIEINVAFIGTIILFEDGSNLFASLIDVGFGVHGFHELTKAYATSFLLIELSHNFINCFFVGLESILSQQQFQIVRQ